MYLTHIIWKSSFAPCWEEYKNIVLMHHTFETYILQNKENTIFISNGKNIPYRSLGHIDEYNVEINYKKKLDSIRINEK